MTNKYWLCGVLVTGRDGSKKPEVIPFVWKIDKSEGRVSIYSDSYGGVVIHQYLPEFVEDVKIVKKEMVHGF